jgi:fatty acid synthase
MHLPDLPPDFDAPTILTRDPVTGSLVHELASGSTSVALTFAGQGWRWWDALEESLTRRTWLRPRAAAWVDLVNDLIADMRLGELGASPWRFDPIRWIEDPSTAPGPGELSALPLSMPGVLLTQLVTYREIWEDGLHAAVSAGVVRAATGHSGGVIAAAAVAADPHGVDELAMQVPAFQLALLIGHVVGASSHTVPHRELAAALRGDAEPSVPMLAVGGARIDRLEEVLASDAECAGVTIGLVHGVNRAVLSGRPQDLASARVAIDRRLGAGDLVWEPLAVSVPCHHSSLDGALAQVLDRASADGVAWGPPAAGIAVVSPDGPSVLCDGAADAPQQDLLPALAAAMLTRQGRWSDAVRLLIHGTSAVRPAQWIIDVGPSDGIAKLSRAATRGTGARVLAMASDNDRQQLVVAGAVPAVAQRYDRYLPRVVQIPGSAPRLENRYTLATGRSPIILAGMTPTTADAGIVAAAANAGFTAELAGGGQVTDEVLDERLRELGELLEPGHEVVFNALYLDPYLWALHLGRQRRVQAARRSGAPIFGVTVSAGVPPVDEAVALLDELVELGIWCNALKAGTIEQIRQILSIADAAPHHTIYAHIEGGTAGGHHSWTDVEDLLLATYHELRMRENVVVCAGGGVGTPDRASQLLCGSWSLRHGERRMPVDALLIGTAAMATLEATTSPAVKELLRNAPGTTAAGTDAGFVPVGSVRGSVRSGRSGLNADIHFLDNSASRCARLLDEVAGDAVAVEARREEIIAALSLTAKPYFGDVSEMTYEELVRRFAELCALGRGGRYDDGQWLDRSHRDRFIALLRRAEGRLHPQESGRAPTDFAELGSADDPWAALRTLLDRHPSASSTRVHPADVGFFLAECQRPGKPVPFVPAIDAQVRRWFQSDSLWQSHHPSYAADAVLVIPGPVSVNGIAKIDQPIADLLASFESQVVADMALSPVKVTHLRRADESSGSGPITALLAAPTVVIDGAVAPNPVNRLGPAEAWSIQRDQSNHVTLASRTITRADGHLEEAQLTEDESSSAGVGAVLLKVSFPATARYGAREPRPRSHDALELRFVWEQKGAVDYFAVDLGQRTHELARLAVDVLGAVGAASDPIGTPVTCSTEQADSNRMVDQRAAHARLIGSSPAVVPDAWLAAAWPAIFATLSAQEIVGSLLDLVHLGHEISLGDQSAADGCASTTAQVSAVSDHPMGTQIDVVARLSAHGGQTVATLSETFLLRGARSTTIEEVPPAETSDAGADAVAPDDRVTKDRPAHRYGAITVRAPESMDRFATISGDLNPIHRSELVARLVGFEGPIVHGAWTSAIAQRCTAELVAGGDAERISHWKAQFLAPVLPGESLDIVVTRTGVVDGSVLAGVAVSTSRAGATIPVMSATATVRPPRTAYVFPGQGIQRQGMGMDALDRSAAARDVWERADRYTRDCLGFSILHIVRENPTALAVRDRSAATVVHRHPAGVLHLTQFTQVAMAALAMSQVAEMREQGVFDEEAIVAGHSVGEYNALASIGGVLPLEVVLELVFRRGQAMHHLVPRDAAGRSDYRLGVVRPHQVAMQHAELEQLVAEIRSALDQTLEIVNFNLKGKQYAVAGTIASLAELESALNDRRGPSSREPFLYVPGIDVPFHSSVLRDGVAEFRSYLDAGLPERIEPRLLVGRYVPNLVPQPFSIQRAYVETVRDHVGSDALTAVLGDFDRWERDPARLTRVLLVELLAWQFASPVRWIETQEILFAEPTRGGLGVTRMIEVGLGTAPTLANLASGTLALDRDGMAGVVVENFELHRLTVFALDDDHEFEPEPEIEQDAASDLATTAVPLPTASVDAPTAATEDRPVDPSDALRWLIASMAKVRPDQLSDGESLDDIVDGVSSRRNQVLMDLGAEFAIAGVDGANELSLQQLASELSSRCRRYEFPGPVLRDLRDAALGSVLGSRRMRARDVVARVSQHWGLGQGWSQRVLTTLWLETRPGHSVRGGALGQLDPLPGTADEAIDAAVAMVAREAGMTLTPRAVGVEATVDAAAVAGLEARIAGPDGLLASIARDVLGRLAPEEGDLDGLDSADEARLGLLDGEHGVRRATAVEPRFDPRRHVAFTSWWAGARHDMVSLHHRGMRPHEDGCDLDAEAVRLARFVGDPGVAAAAAYYRGHAAARGDMEAEHRFGQILTGAAGGMAVPSTGPAIDDRGAALEVEASSERIDSMVTQLLSTMPTWSSVLEEQLELLRSDDRSAGLSGQVALVTGASPGSIAWEVVRRLLHGGARVVCTTSDPSPERLAKYRELYRNDCSPGAELHVIPANLASFGDIDAIADWMVARQPDQALGASVPKRDPMVPTLVVPFAAGPAVGDMPDAGPDSEVPMRLLVWGVERLIGRLAESAEQQGTGGARTTVVVPLSPNHGGFGGDGAYGEAKAALEAVLHKWHSEQHRWGRHIDLVAPTIGWVRGTGLMDGNDALAALVERDLGVRTFSAAEMAWLLVGLCCPATVAATTEGPTEVDLSGGLRSVPCIRDAVAPLVAELDELTDAPARAQADLGDSIDTVPALLSPVVVEGDPSFGAGPDAPTRPLDDIVVVVGVGEVGPWGGSGTRFDLEVDGELADGSVAELAWACGLVRFDPDLSGGGGWVDSETDEQVEESDLAPRYRDAVLSNCGIRVLDTDGPLDPDGVSLMAEVFTETDLVLPAVDEADARAYVAADPDGTRMRLSPSGEWQVVRRAGTSIRVPRRAALSRRVGAQVPRGFDPTLWGVPAEMAASVDRLSLWNLVATVEAFLDAGLEPEELLRSVHPARVGSTQGSGMGGMTSIQRLYRDAVLGGHHASDLLQEGLANVVAAYVVQSYVGSYGPMVHPVAACATAAVSLEDGVDKIRAGKADVIVAGGWDDLALEGVLGFADMSATASTDDMLAAGFEPRQFSRANDRRRAGFVEAQGGGTILLARASVALDLGLPVRGVLVSAQSFADGVQTSIPAPGLGALACALGGDRSPLAVALADHGLSVDDIAVVSKHDTSTAANDPNESELHQRIAESLGRTCGNPMIVVSQKTVTGHAKGGSAAWQAIGLLQILESGQVPGNRNLECLDETHRNHLALAYGHRSINAGEPLRAGLLTSLGFGHVSAVVCCAAAGTFYAAVRANGGDAALDEYLARSRRRRIDGGLRRLAQRFGGQPTYAKRVDRRLRGAEGSPERRAAEASLLTDADARLGSDGLYGPGRGEDSR